VETYNTFFSNHSDAATVQWSGGLVEELEGPYYSNFSHFVEPEGSLLHSQELATYPYPESD
jgi:hypothetical protein